MNRGPENPAATATAPPPGPIEARRDDFAAFGLEMLELVRVVLLEAERDAAGPIVQATGDEVRP